MEQQLQLRMETQSTGDATPYVILAVTVAAAAGVMVVAFKRRKA